MAAPYLFPDFLSSEERFAECVMFWHGLMNELVALLGQEGEWAREYTNSPGTPDGPPRIDLYVRRDMRDIYEAHSPRQRRAFQIRQLAPPWQHGAAVAADLKDVLDSDGQPECLLLLLRFVLSQETADRVRKLLLTFMDPRTSDSAIRALVETEAY